MMYRHFIFTSTALAALALLLLASCAKPEEEPMETWTGDSTDGFWGKGTTDNGQMNVV